MGKTTIDTIETFPGQFLTGSRLNMNALRPAIDVRNAYQRNALLQKTEWEEIDAAVVRVAMTTLAGVQDLLDLGLVQRLGGLGTLISTYEQLGNMSDANISMDGETPGEEDSTPYSPISLPVPIIHKDFRINIRTLEASRRLGDALDTTGVETATRKVNETIEAMLMNGTGAPKVGTNQGQGYTNKTQRIADTAANFGGGDWGTELNPFKTVNGMVNQLAAKGYPGPYGCYAARVQYGEATRMLTDGSGKTEIRAMLDNIVNLKFTKASDDLTAGSIVVVSLQKDVVDIAIAQDITPVQWSSMGGMVEHFKVMTAVVPRVKHDADGNAGVAHATSA